jgi:hypothetical protein
MARHTSCKMGQNQLHDFFLAGVRTELRTLRDSYHLAITGMHTVQRPLIVPDREVSR